MLFAAELSHCDSDHSGKNLNHTCWNRGQIKRGSRSRSARVAWSLAHSLSSSRSLRSLEGPHFSTLIEPSESQESRGQPFRGISPNEGIDRKSTRLNSS